MHHRLLGRTGLLVSNLSLGSMTFGAEGRFAPLGAVSQDHANELVSRAIDADVNVIDTANVYSGGRAERMVGEALRGRRDSMYIATKVGMAMGKGPNEEGLTRTTIRQHCEASLRRLQTDHIDLYFLHRWDGLTALEETLSALDNLVRAGKVRYVGCSNFSAWHMMKALGIAERDDLPRFVATQNFYAPAFREAEYELIPGAIDQDVGFMVWGPLAGGLLTGKYRHDGGSAPRGRHHHGWPEPPIRDQAALDRTIDVLRDVADQRGITASQAALAWTLQRPGVTSLVVGARSREQFDQSLAVGDIKLSIGEVQRIDTAAPPPLVYPYWHQLKNASSRLANADLALLENRDWT